MKRLFLFGVWLAFVALLLQLAGWVYFSIGNAKPIEGYGYPAGLFVPHPTLDFAYRPGFSGLFKGAGYRDIPIEINDLGFRDAPFGEPSAGPARIAFLGDSVVFGAGVRVEDRFTECLEAADPVQAHGRPAPSILNLGVNSYSFGHYLALAELDFLGLEPSAVVVGLTLNDFAPMEEAGPAVRLRRHAEGVHTPHWLARIKDRLGGTSAADWEQAIHRASKVFGLAVSPLRNAGNVSTLADKLGALARAELETCQVLTDRLAALCSDWGISQDDSARLRSAVAVLTLLGGLVAESDPKRRVELLATASDPYADFARQPEPQSLFLVHDGVHYSPAGHRLVCAAVRRCLDDWGFLGR